MQKHLLFTLTMFVTGFSIHAQNTFPASGKVGIGTTSPLTLLHVNGTGSFGANITTGNATRTLNLADANAVMRILRIHPTNAPAIELLSRTSADGVNVAYWDLYTEPSDKSFRIRDRVTGSNLDRFTINNSGNVGIGTTAPNASSLLELNSITKGLLTPRMTTAQRNAIGSPAQGLLIFQTDGTKGFYYYDAGWKTVSSSSGGSGANTSLSNLSSPTAVNQHLLPQTTKVYDLGSNALSWRNLYVRDDIYLDGTRFVSNAPGTASFNAFLGSNSGLAVSDGISNTAIGQDALRNTTTGSRNTALGKQALFTNVTGSGNVALGNKALFASVANGGNVAIGDSALATYDDGGFNDYMVAVGQYALAGNTTGYYNTAVGGNTLISNTTGAANTAIGFSADVSSGSFGNATALGYNAVATASNQVMLGSTTVTSVMAAGPHVIYSDGRFKRDVQPGVPGLSFINKLRPVTYHYDIHGLNNQIRKQNQEEGHRIDGRSRQQETELRQKEEEGIKAKEQILYTGFVAQEVEQAAKEVNYDFSGVYKPQNNHDVYGLSYADFVVPLVKAVQELSKENEQLKKHNDDLEVRLQKLEAVFLNAGSISPSSAYLENAIPNPSRSTTTIRYQLPDGTATARLTFYNIKGQVLKEVYLAGRGPGQVNLSTANLPAGVYTYSLWIDGQQAATRQLVIAR